jgi:hypothetical protein
MGRIDTRVYAFECNVCVCVCFLFFLFLTILALLILESPGEDTELAADESPFKYDFVKSVCVCVCVYTFECEYDASMSSHYFFVCVLFGRPINCVDCVRFKLFNGTHRGGEEASCGATTW